ncbi:Sporulation kinase C [Desulfosporosinus sp. I2]|nr:Sporulation kinase C [Desulfosporosinus sp. I2]
MISLKIRFRSLFKQSIFIVLTAFLIIAIIFVNVSPIFRPIHIILLFIAFFTLIIWFELWFSSWGKVWILSITLLMVSTRFYSIFPSGPLLIVHLIFLLAIIILFNWKETRERARHQNHINTMRALLWQNPPLIKTVDYSYEAIILLDKTGEIIESNPRSTYLLGLTKSSLVGQPISKVLGILNNFQPNKLPEVGEFCWKTPKRETKYLRFQTRPLLNHNIPAGTLLTLFDISEEKKCSEAYVQIAKFSIINEVSAGLAHEIRNPLTTIKGFMQLITPEQWPESYRPYQQLVLDEIYTIEQVLSKFLLIASPSAPQIELLSLAETIHATTQLIQPLRDRKAVTIVLELSSNAVYIMGDPEQLLQALLSILKNAIEASPQGGSVIIRLTDHESHVRISVIDNGPGIPENLRNRVLDPFFSTHKEGTGLGLTIAQQIILAHHGMLHICDSIGTNGTEVLIDFPSLATITSNLSA